MELSSPTPGAYDADTAPLCSGPSVPDDESHPTRGSPVD